MVLGYILLGAAIIYGNVSILMQLMDASQKVDELSIKLEATDRRLSKLQKELSELKRVLSDDLK